VPDIGGFLDGAHLGCAVTKVVHHTYGDPLDNTPDHLEIMVIPKDTSVRLNNNGRRALFAIAGRAIFGEEWHNQMAVALKVTRRNIRRWETGYNLLPESVMVEVAELVRAEARRLNNLADSIWS